MIVNEFKKYEVVPMCDLCGSKNIEDHFKAGDIVICSDCGFLFVSPRPSVDDIQNSYSDDAFYDGWIREAEGRLKLWQKRYQRTKEFIKSPSNILDYSAGIGTFMHLAKMDGNNVFGTELSTSAKKIAADQYGLELLDSDYFFNSKYQNYFDAITAWHVVEHVISPRTLVAHFFQILRPGGFLFAAVPNAKEKTLKKLFFKVDPEHNFPKLKVGDELHLSQFTNVTIRRLLESAGFSIVKVGIDDHYVASTFKNRFKYQIFDAIYKATNKNYSPTIFIVAKK